MPTTSTGMGTFTTIMDGLSTEVTTSYPSADGVGRVAFNTHGSRDVVFLMDVTTGGATSIQFQVEVFDASEGWVVVPYDDGAVALALEASITGTGDEKRWTVRNLGRFEQQVRISVKSTGATNGSTSVTVLAQLASSNYPIAGNVV